MQYTPPPVDRWIIGPIKRFINNSTTSGILLFSSAILALIAANSPLADEYHHLWELKFSIGFGENFTTKPLHHWINDGLMAVFFFVVGLELKREVIAGHLRSPGRALLPVVAAAGGMTIPALIYILINPAETQGGWGIPMATDIAFALGVLYLLGDKVPLAVKVFLTAVAIVDDLGAVLVIAFFYTSQINFESLMWAGIFLGIMIGGNLIGVRSSLFYATFGIVGLWQAFLMSGVHPTIAAVLAAFTVPGTVKVSEDFYTEKITYLLKNYKHAERMEGPTVTPEQFSILNKIRGISKAALTPLQALEHTMHPLVAFVIMPIFAFSNAGVDLSGDLLGSLVSPVTLGIIAGLLLGKFIGVVGTVWLVMKIGKVHLPEGMRMAHLRAVGLLAGIGFTMSLFISGLAFKDPDSIEQAKLGILIASTIASVIGYFIFRNAMRTDVLKRAI